MRIYWLWFEDKFKDIGELANFRREYGYHGLVFDTRDVGEGCVIFVNDELDEKIKKRLGEDLIDWTPSVIEDPRVPEWYKKKLWKSEIMQYKKYCPYVRF